MAPREKSIRKIIVAGDIAVDWLQWPQEDAGQAADSGSPVNWRLQRQTRMAPKPGGALLLASWLKANFGGRISFADVDTGRIKPTDAYIQSFVNLGRFPASKTGKGARDVFRAGSSPGYMGPESGKARQHKVADDDPAAGMVVLDDAGNGFRDARSAWPAAIREKGRTPVVLMKICRPLMQGALWNHVIKTYPDNLVVVVDANDLREEGMDVSRRLSWERTVRDFAWQIAMNRDWAQLAYCRNLVVRLGLDGAIHYSRDEGGARITLYYDPGRAEDGFAGEVGGTMTGLGSAFAAALAGQLAGKGLAGISEGIRDGILSARRLLMRGFGSIDSAPDYPAKEIFRTSGLDSLIANIQVPPASTGETADPGFWTIMDEVTRGRIEDNVLDYMIKGRNDRFDRVPKGRFGKLVTLDRAEIESFHSIRNLISGYLKEETPPRPLSIAVFGPPGSGKSFSVTQVADSISPGVVTRLEFNLSQLDTQADLARVMHQVRDVVLKGRVPLVFFDEFDSGLNGEALGWLKYFLEPMQSGDFREGDGVHPIGKAIFVFAGGTCSNLDEFSRTAGTPEEKRQFKNAKGPDFVSRLKGYVDIFGVNPLDETDSLCLARRAILLRILIAQKGPQLFDASGRLRIDPGVLRALIKIPEYRHGARSMEAILDMSQLAGHRTFEQSVLPPTSQLELHVDAEQFSRLISRDMLFGGVREQLARTIHADLVANLEKRGEQPEDRPAMQPWESLPEFLKDSFRNQADAFPEYLKAMGYGFIPATGDEPARVRFTSGQLERAARLAHEKWVEEMKAAGWKYGPVPDEPSRTHPLIREWKKLPVAETKKYRDEVRTIPHYLSEVGFEVYPLKG